MKKLLLATAVAAVAGSVAQAEDVKLGILFGFTGPLESMTPDMKAAVDLAIKEVNDSGALLGGASVSGVTGDTGCIDNQLAVASAEKLITSDGVKGIIGGMCSGETGAVLQNVAIPNNMVMISPSATSPGLSTVEDNGLFFRTSPSDARQGQIMSEVIKNAGISKVAVTYTNNDYGKGLADSFEEAFKAAGGTVTLSAAHEDGKADYSAEVGALAAAGGDMLVVVGYVDQGGGGMVKAALDSGAFDKFYFPDGMVGITLENELSPLLPDGSLGDIPGTDSAGAQKFMEMGRAAGFNPTNAFSPQSYDAAAVILLAMQAAGSTDPSVYKDKVMDVANAPGEKIQPGDLAHALQVLKDGGDIDYEGASDVEFLGPGDAAGKFRLIAINGGKMATVGYK